MTTTATIDQLLPGTDYPGGSINSRKDYTPQEVKDRLESILTFGVLQSLCVCPEPGKTGGPFFVAAGGLRRAAIELGVKTKKLAADFPIPITVRTDWDSAMALAASLEENEQVLAPHPVRVYEQFAELISRGKTDEEIAKLFHMEMKEVRKALKLGRLSPKIRKAWIDEEIDADDAKAFTLAKDQKHQDDVFARLQKQRTLSSWQIKNALVGDQNSADKFLKLIGREAYEAAGGKIQEDLFTRDDQERLVVTDLALLVRLVGEKIGAKCKELVAAGWGWASDEGDIKNIYSLARVPNAGVGLSKELKAKSGCAVDVNHNGKLEVTYGLLKKGERLGNAASADKTAKSGAPPPSNKISNSLSSDLDAMAARATKDALVADKYGDALAIMLASIVAAQITPDRYSYMPRAVLEKLPAIRNGITPAVMAEAFQKRFDRQRYFGGAPKTLVIKAVAESVSAVQAKKLEAGTKAAAWKFALANVPKTWLPRELRTSNYDGPGAKSATVTKLKPKAKPAKKTAPKKRAA